MRTACGYHLAAVVAASDTNHHFKSEAATFFAACARSVTSGNTGAARCPDDARRVVDPAADAVAAQYQRHQRGLCGEFNQVGHGVAASDFKVLTDGSVQTTTPVVVRRAAVPRPTTVTINGIHGDGDLTLDLIDNDSILGSSTRSAALATITAASRGRRITSCRRTHRSCPSFARRPPRYQCDERGLHGDVQRDGDGCRSHRFPAGEDRHRGRHADAGDAGQRFRLPVTVSGITGNGSLGLNLVDNSGHIRDSNGNPLGQVNAAPFAPPVSFTTGSGPASVVAADVNGDGRPDLIVANAFSNTVSVLLGNGNGAFQAAVNLTAPAQIRVPWWWRTSTATASST